MKFVNCDIDEETFKALKEMGAIKVKSGVAKRLTLTLLVKN